MPRTALLFIGHWGESPRYGSKVGRGGTGWDRHHLATLSAPLQIRRRGVETKIVVGEAQSDPDRHLQTMLIRAHRWTRALAAGTSLAEIARAEGCSEAFLRTRAKLAFLSPKIQTAILDGTQPPDCTLTKLVRLPLPLDWQEQERALGA